MQCAFPKPLWYATVCAAAVSEDSTFGFKLRVQKRILWQAGFAFRTSWDGFRWWRKNVSGPADSLRSGVHRWVTFGGCWRSRTKWKSSQTGALTLERSSYRLWPEKAESCGQSQCCWKLCWQRFVLEYTSMLAFLLTNYRLTEQTCHNREDFSGKCFLKTGFWFSIGVMFQGTGDLLPEPGNSWCVTRAAPSLPGRSIFHDGCRLHLRAGPKETRVCV